MTPGISPLHAYVLDPLERAGSTFVQQFVVLMLPLMVIVNGKLAVTGSALIVVLDVSAFAALISIITSVLTFKVSPLNPEVDLLVRVAKTYLQSVLGALTVTTFIPSVLHASWGVVLLGAIPVAAAALLKGLAALALPWSDGASLLPSPLAAGRHEQAALPAAPHL